MGKGTRRARKQRRRLKMTLNHGHQVRHKLISGRTGSVHSKRLLSPKKEDPTGEVKVIVRYPKLVITENDAIEVKEPVILRPRRIRIRAGKILAPATGPEIVQVVEEGPETTVEGETYAYAFCLRALDFLSNLTLEKGSRGANLREDLNRMIERFEKR